MMMKHCGRCQQTKSTDEFHRRGSGWKSWCKDCTRDYDRLYQQANNARRAPVRKAYQRAFAEWFLDLKRDIPCANCGQILHPVAMDWHHKDSTTKTIAVSELIRTTSKKRVLDEIAKCELWCVICHRIHSYEESLRDEGVPGSPTALDAGRSREFESHHPDLIMKGYDE